MTEANLTGFGAPRRPQPPRRQRPGDQAAVVQPVPEQEPRASAAAQSAPVPADATTQTVPVSAPPQLVTPIAQVQVQAPASATALVDRPARRLAEPTEVVRQAVPAPVAAVSVPPAAPATATTLAAPRAAERAVVSHDTKEFKPQIPSSVKERLDQERRRAGTTNGEILIDAVKKAIKGRVFDSAFSSRIPDQDDEFADIGVARRRTKRPEVMTNVTFRITQPERALVEKYAKLWSAAIGLPFDDEAGFPPGAIVPGEICSVALDADLPPREEESKSRRRSAG